MNKPGVLIVALVLAAGLTACSGGGTDAAADPASGTTTTATEPATSAAPSDAAPSDAAPSDAASGGAGVNATLTGLVTLLAPGSILVESNANAQEALLADDTLVLDLKGNVCATGAAPHRCTWKQLEQALDQDTATAFHAKVTIKGGVAVRVEEVAKG